MDESSHTVDAPPAWLFAVAGQQYGPVTEAELDELRTEGRIQPDTLVWRQGLADWIPFSQLKPEMPMATAVPASRLILTYSSDRPEPTNVFGWWWRAVSQDYASFRGRARRKEFWSFALVNLLVYAGILVLAFLIPTGGGNAMASAVFACLVGGGILFYLGIFVPYLAAAVRRLHDTGKSGWWFCVAFVPYVGGLILLVLLAKDSEPADNVYGPNPKSAFRQRP